MLQGPAQGALLQETLQGVGLGILIACVLFIFSYGRTSSIKHTLSGRNSQSNVFRTPSQQRLLEQEGESVTILILHGFVFFGTANDRSLKAYQRRVPQINALGLLSTSGFNTFEDRDQPPLDKALAAKPAVCQKPDSGKAFYYAFREKNAEGRDTVRGLFVVRCGGIESREGEEATAYGQLLVYSGDGQLDLLVTEGKVTEFGFSDRGGKKVLTAARQLEDDRLHTLAEPTKVASSGAGQAGPAAAP